eukprot:gene29319-35394_t
MRLFASLLSLCSLFGPLVLSYKLSKQYVGKDFFNGFNFVTYDDPTHGYVNYVDVDTAWSKRLVSVRDNDYTNIVPQYSRGRDSIRLESTTNFTKGLFILDLDHMPHGCGSWPAFWTVGPNWPYSGEIDIIENVHESNVNQQTLHTGADCSQSGSTSQMTGSWACTNCDVFATGNAGCGVVGPADSYGAEFNNGQGGVYAMEWTDNYIQVFFFPRSTLPANVLSSSPDPSSWGQPVGYWSLGSSCSAEHFQAHQIVFDDTFCGDWAGATFAAACPSQASAFGSCEAYVQNSPGDFKDAFWLINSLKVYEM